MRRATVYGEMSDGPWASPISETLYPAEEFWPVVAELSVAAPAPPLENDRDERSPSGVPMVDGRAPSLSLSQAANALPSEAQMASQRVSATAR